jgi:hypothetical protein
LSALAVTTELGVITLFSASRRRRQKIGGRPAETLASLDFPRSPANLRAIHPASENHHQKYGIIGILIDT